MKRHVILLASLLVTVAACGDGDDPVAGDADATSTTITTISTISTSSIVAPVSTEPAATTSVTTVEPPPDTDPPDTDPPDTEPATSDPVPSDDCLVGDWVVAEAEMNRFYDAMQADIDGSAMENELLSSSPINSAPVDCSGPTPVIDFATGIGSVPITLTPA